MDHALAYTNPPHAAYALCEQLTGLPPHLLQPIGGTRSSTTRLSVSLSRSQRDHAPTKPFPRSTLTSVTSSPR